jgi:hypothetical protein
MASIIIRRDAAHNEITVDGKTFDLSGKGRMHAARRAVVSFLEAEKQKEATSK